MDNRRNKQTPFYDDHKKRQVAHRKKNKRERSSFNKQFGHLDSDARKRAIEKIKELKDEE